MHLSHKCHDSKFVNIDAGLAANQAMNKQQTEREQSQDSSICQLCTMTCIISLARAGLWGSPPAYGDQWKCKV